MKMCQVTVVGDIPLESDYVFFEHASDSPVSFVELKDEDAIRDVVMSLENVEWHNKTMLGFGSISLTFCLDSGDSGDYFDVKQMLEFLDGPASPFFQ